MTSHLDQLFDPEDTLLAAQDAKFNYKRSAAARLPAHERMEITMGIGLEEDSMERHSMFIIKVLSLACAKCGVSAGVLSGLTKRASRHCSSCHHGVALPRLPAEERG